MGVHGLKPSEFAIPGIQQCGIACKKITLNSDGDLFTVGVYFIAAVTKQSIPFGGRKKLLHASY